MSDISWQDDIPISNRFDDIYYSKDNGLEESTHVFIKGNDIDAQLQKNSAYVIGELGFGTGLNFCNTLRYLPKHCHLTYIAFEQYPLTYDEIKRALSAWPDIYHYKDQIGNHYPISTKGTHLLPLEDNLDLHLIFGDANETIHTMPTHVDAWYLDGFNPSKNLSLWNESLLKAIARHTNTQGTFATYSAARLVKDNLKSAGFSYTRIKGYGKKRDMLKGIKLS